MVNRKLTKFKSDDCGYFVKQVRYDDKEEIRSIEHAEKAVRSLYYAMRKAILARAEFTLQGQLEQFNCSLHFFVTALIEEVKMVGQQQLIDLGLDKVIITDIGNNVAQDPPQLPEELFSFDNTIKQNTTSKKEVVEYKKEKQYYTKGSCFKANKNRFVSKNIYNNIEYR